MDAAFSSARWRPIETLIWLLEADPAERVGVEIPGDGGAWARQCCKMATGTGKTLVMAMVLAWQFLNRAAYPQDGRFARHALIMAPGITVRSRLEVLRPDAEGNYYELFQIVPGPLMEMLRQGKVVIRNWQSLSWDTPEKLRKRRSVDKRGAKSDEAYCREVLGELAASRDLLVLNDEAHHAWRIPAEFKGRRGDRELFDEATVWVGGLDRRASEMLTWFTSRPCFPAKRSIVSAVVLDSGWEGSEAFHLDHDPRVAAWVKNDHLGFEIFYTHEGVVRRYRPDYLARRTDGIFLIIETKGRVTPDVLSKKAAAEEWIEAVNATGRFGEWRYALCEKPQAVLDALG